MTNPFVFCIEEADIRLNVTQLRPEMVFYEPIADLTNEKTNKQTNKKLTKKTCKTRYYNLRTT